MKRLLQISLGPTNYVDGQVPFETFETSNTFAEITHAFIAGVKKLGINICSYTTIHLGYGKKYNPYKQHKKIKKLFTALLKGGYPKSKIRALVQKTELVNGFPCFKISMRQWADIFVFTCLQGTPEIDIEHRPDDLIMEIYLQDYKKINPSSGEWDD